MNDCGFVLTVGILQRVVFQLTRSFHSWNIRTLPDSNIKSIEDLFAIQDQLYEAGARNFCFMDVAPLHRFPRGAFSYPRFPGP